MVGHPSYALLCSETSYVENPLFTWLAISLSTLSGQDSATSILRKVLREKDLPRSAFSSKTSIHVELIFFYFIHLHYLPPYESQAANLFIVNM